MSGDPPRTPDRPPLGGAGISRRSQLLAALGVGAAAAAAGLLWFKDKNPAQSDAVSELALADERFWALRLDAPEGGQVALQTFRGKPLLVNFWATWCPPCVEELPLINAFVAQNSSKRFQVLGIAADNLNAVKQFMVKLPLQFPVALAGLGGVEISRELGNLSGGLPFTVLFGSQGKVLHRKMGRITTQDLAAWGQLT